MKNAIDMMPAMVEGYMIISDNYMKKKDYN